MYSFESSLKFFANSKLFSSSTSVLSTGSVVFVAAQMSNSMVDPATRYAAMLSKSDERRVCCWYAWVKGRLLHLDGYRYKWMRCSESPGLDASSVTFWLFVKKCFTSDTIVVSPLWCSAFPWELLLIVLAMKIADTRHSRHTMVMLIVTVSTRSTRLKETLLPINKWQSSTTILWNTPGFVLYIRINITM